MNILWGPKVKDHPSIGIACPLCDIPFKEGDMTVPLGNIPASKNDNKLRGEGKPYTGIVREVHQDCGEMHKSKSRNLTIV